ncbi:hypothetical protein KSP39_PZI012918 [Platanthera zijinensis]|uniref:DDE Tnp4 domain-containing protein n=1 Tax=Platanthera zijinensis TaxID=2320716 RepID=A0AAP0BDE9_9ASPA
MGYLKPYPDTRYHLADYARGSRPVRGRQEHFNKAHSSLRSVIERTFGVWKKKWRILSKMPQYTFKKQRSIVLATMALHNYIRRHPSRWDPEFNACDADEASYVPLVDENPAAEDDIESDVGDVVGAEYMSAVRDSIAEEIYMTRR